MIMNKYVIKHTFKIILDKIKQTGKMAQRKPVSFNDSISSDGIYLII